ncbi:hypothetical protein HFO97_27855 [Rhizobium leguminosarum]|uniref:hypothetical protein n=1 Tax=Rhizobium leguminosarum TaxID=384 RepID=UPI001C955E3E|nr:hypothetical protein [Rhizobium leguminosarum]MBY5363689.1 hypothetical protein [Rhizobium leguminosarum]
MSKLSDIAGKDKAKRSPPNRKKDERNRRRAAFQALDLFIQANVAANEGAVVFLLPMDAVPFKFGGQQEYVTTSDINAYSQHLMTRQIAERVTKDKGKVYRFRLTPMALASMKSPAFSSFAPIQPTFDESRQNPVSSNLVVRKQAPSMSPPGQMTGLPILPAAVEMCLPILNRAIKPMKYSQLTALIADHFQFSPSLIALPLPKDTNQTFLLHMQVAAEFLVGKGLLSRADKLYVRTPAGEHRAATGDPTFPDLVEPAVRTKLTRSTNLSSQARAAFHTINTDIDKVIATFETAEPEKLVAIYQNAVRILGESTRRIEHPKAKKIIEALQIEFEKRDKNVSGGGRFRWPTTEARSGDGSFQFPTSQTEGMLAYLDYRVGRTHGVHSTIRQSILSRVFEKSLPPSFEKSYMDEWGSNGSAARLRKIAESVASFARNAKRRNEESLAEAIRHWEQDLKFLHDRYYVGKFNFGWPSTTVEEAKRRI